MKIGVAISTRNRPKSFAACYEAWKRCLPVDAVLVIVDDASEEPYANADYRFETNAGIPAVKNKCIELLYYAECTDVFLSDDDAWPVSSDSLLPYLNSNINHLSFTFTHFANGKANADKTFAVTEIKRDGDIAWYTTANGCILYYKRICFDTVGGMDPAYGLGMFEHVDLSHRIHNAGLIPHPYMDVVGSDKLWHSLDHRMEAGRTWDYYKRLELCERNRPIFQALGEKATFIDFRDFTNIHRSAR